MNLSRQQQAEIRARIALAVNILSGMEKAADDGRFDGLHSSLMMMDGALAEVHTILDTDAPKPGETIQAALIREEYDDVV